MKRLFSCIFACVICFPLLGATSTVADTLYRADGSLYSGRLTITYPTFVRADGRTIFAGSIRVTVSSGKFSVALEPTSTSTPQFQYRVEYALTPSTTTVEYWTVPVSASPLELTAVRTTFQTVPPNITIPWQAMSGAGFSNGEVPSYNSETRTFVPVSVAAGNVTSVGLSLPSMFTVTGSPVTSAGTISATLASQSANRFLGAPDGTEGTPTFRVLVADDIPSLEGLYAALSHSHAISDVTGLSTALSGKEPIITAGTTAQYWRGDKSWQILDKTAVGLGNVENTALSTWAGSTNITTLGTISTGTVPWSLLSSVPSTFAPSSHASSHQNGGSDEIATATAAANAIPKAGAGGTLSTGWIPDLSATYQAVSGKGAASGYASLDAGTKVPIAQLPTGSTSSTVALGNDARLSDARTPTAHAASHRDGGSDEVATATAAANAIPKAGSGGELAWQWLPAMVGDSGSGGLKGAVPAPAAGDTAAGKFLNASGGWSVPSGSGGGDVLGPVTNTDNYIPQWNGANSKTLKDGLAVSTSAMASAIAQRNASGEVIAANTVATGKTPMATDTAVSLSQLANQGTITTVLHGNASGNPSFAAVTASDFGVQNANKVLAGPVSGGDAIPTFRALVSADIPNNAANTSGTAGGLTNQYIDWNASSGGASIANKPTLSGNTTELATVSGTKTASKQLAFDADGNVVASAYDVGSGGAGASDFTDLGDTPSAYTSQALKLLRVNAGETAIEFLTLQSGLVMDGSGLGIDTAVVPTKSSNNTFVGTQTFQNTVTISGASAELDARGATATSPFQSGTTAASPATCLANEEYYNATDGSLNRCNATGDGWTTIGSSGAALRSFGFMLGADNGSALADTDDQPTIWFNSLGGGVTITSVWCESDGGTPTINLQKDDGSAADILSSALTCTTSGASSTSFVSGENSVASTNKIDLSVVSAGGTAKRITVFVTYTID